MTAVAVSSARASSATETETSFTNFLLRNDELAAISRLAAASQVHVELRGQSAARALESYRAATSKSEKPQTLALREIFLPNDAIEISVTGPKEKIAPILAAINKIVYPHPYRLRFWPLPSSIRTTISDLHVALDRRDPIGQAEINYIENHRVDVDSLPTTVAATRDGQRAQFLELIAALTEVYSVNGNLSEAAKSRVRQFLNHFNVDFLKVQKAQYNPYSYDRSKRSETGYYRELTEKTDLLYNQMNSLSEMAKLVEDLGLVDWFRKISADVDPLVVLRRDILEPKTIGEGHGKTASELGISNLNHQISTKKRHRVFDSSVYETLGRKSADHLNSYISSSRWGIAQFGDGFYTSKDDNYYYNNEAWTLHFEIDPRARLGSDFEIKGDGFVIVKNRNALKLVTPPHADFSQTSIRELLDQALRFIASGADSTFAHERVEQQYNALLELKKRSQHLSEAERAEFTNWVNEISEDLSARRARNDEFYEQLFTLDFEHNYLGDLMAFVQRPHRRVNIGLIFANSMVAKYAFDDSPPTRELIERALAPLEAGEKTRLEQRLALEKRIADLASQRARPSGNLCRRLVTGG